MSHKKWVPVTGERETALRQEMIQYVEGYILACNDVLEDLDEVLSIHDTEEMVFFAGQIRRRIQDGLRQARKSLRQWKELPDEQGPTEPTAD